MSRWEPGARGRLEQAALALYAEHGFDQTTVANIASRAGVTERTFFRHFADKREVLFSGSAALREVLVSTVATAPDGTGPIDAVAGALDAAAATVFGDRLEPARQRQAVIVAHAGLRERELIKLAGLGADVAEALRRRGVAEPAASLAAETGIVVLKVAFERWVADTDRRDLADLLRECFDELQSITGRSRSAAV